MATRATYQINGVTFYIHHDGYMEGAAVYFYNALTAGQHFLAESFLRKNERAEFTHSHESHGDTEFRYTVMNDKIVVHNMQYGTDSWEEVFNGSLKDFVNNHSAMIDNFTPIK